MYTGLYARMGTFVALGNIASVLLILFGLRDTANIFFSPQSSGLYKNNKQQHSEGLLTL